MHPLHTPVCPHLPTAFVWQLTSTSLYKRLCDFFSLPSIRQLRKFSSFSTVKEGIIDIEYLKRRSASWMTMKNCNTDDWNSYSTTNCILKWCCCDRKSRAACAQSFAPWQQATIEITRRDHSIIACSRHIHIFVFFAHIPFVVNHTTNSTPPERLQHS